MRYVYVNIITEFSGCKQNVERLSIRKYLGKLHSDLSNEMGLNFK